METFARFWTVVPAGIRKSVAQAYSRLVASSDRQRKLATLLGGTGEHTNPYVLARGLFTLDQQQRLLKGYHETFSREEDTPINASLKRAMLLDPINRVSYLEMRNYMLNTLLRDTDAMSMAHGLEVRVPLIDHKLVEYVFALPGRMKMNAQTPKQLLVEAMKGALPTEIVNRPKRGFELPFQHWLKDEMRGEVEQTFHRASKSSIGDFLSAQSIQAVWSEFLGGRISWSRPWALYVLQRWCEMHL